MNFMQSTTSTGAQARQASGANKRAAPELPNLRPPPRAKPKIEYFRLPQPSDVLAGTPQCCMWDTEPLPEGREVVRAPMRFAKETYHVTGQFCSFSCAMAYIRRNQNMFPRDALQLLCQMAKRYYAIYGIIREAPPQQALKKFGGHLSVEEFRSRCTTHFSVLRQPPHCFEDLRIEEKPRSNEPRAEVKSTLTPEAFKAQLEAAAKECLEKKQRKGNKLYANSLENLIGIKRQKLG